MSIDIKDVFELLANNSEFVKKIETSIKQITKDENIDSSDIPELIFIITESYNAYNAIKITQNDLPIFIKMVFNEIINKKNLISADKKPEFDKLVDSALKLLMMQPRIHDAVESCFSCLSCLPCFKDESKKDCYKK